MEESEVTAQWAAQWTRGRQFVVGQNQKTESFKTTNNALSVISKYGGSSVRDGREGQTIH